MKLLLPLLFIQCTAWSQWTKLDDVQDDYRCDDIFFIDDSTGWVACGNGEIYRTDDQGVEWEKQFDEPFTYFRSIEFFDENIGFAGSLIDGIYKTVDGGDNWYSFTDSMPGTYHSICGLSIPDDSTIYGSGIWWGPAYIYKSTNKGTTWTYLDMSPYAHGLIDVYFIDALHGFATGQSNDAGNPAIILYTSNGGETWEMKKQGLFPSEYAWKFQMLNEEIAICSIQNLTDANPGRIWISEDGGMNWETIVVGDTVDNIQMVGFISRDTGWVGGYFDGLYETFDGGDTWHWDDYGTAFNRFIKLNDTVAFASGAGAFRYDKEVVTDTTQDTTTEINSFKPPHAILGVNPNPATNYFTVDYQIDRNTFIDLAIYDSKGLKVTTIFYGRIAAGIYHWQSDSELEAGAYVISMHSNEGIRTYKFIVIQGK